jgi:anti-sigma B factor antagonist
MPGTFGERLTTHRRAVGRHGSPAPPEVKRQTVYSIRCSTLTDDRAAAGLNARECFRFTTFLATKSRQQLYNYEGEYMHIDFESLDNGVLKINLSGRMDLQGTLEIDQKFAVLTAAQNAQILVDMSQVSFLASLGMRTLLSSAKAVSARGALMILYKPQANVLEALTISGTARLIPVYHKIEEAKAAFSRHHGG